jgi:hypothetical protein
MNAENLSDDRLKTLWGAAEMPSATLVPNRIGIRTLKVHPLLHSCAKSAPRCSGPNGIGKLSTAAVPTSCLKNDKISRWLTLAQRSDLIRALCRQLGVQPQMRRSKRGQYPSFLAS